MSNKINVQMKQFNGTDYDNIYPDGKNGMAAQIIVVSTSPLNSIKAINSNGTIFNGVSKNPTNWIIEVNEYGDYTIEGTRTTGGTVRTELVVDKCKQYKASFLSPILNNNLWETIRAYSDKGLAESTWAVGDTKQIAINGKVGNTTLSNLTINVFILGFNHNASKEGNNRIHFQIGKIGVVPVGLCDAKYNSIGDSGYFTWNTSDSNSGGWKSCYKRSTLYGNSGTPTSPPSGSLMAALPSNLRAVMKSVNKYTDNKGYGSGSAQNVTSTTDYLFDLAEFEVFGSRSYANEYEQDSQLQYDYYKNGNNKIAYKHFALSTAIWWGLRSPEPGVMNTFRIVTDEGRNNSRGAIISGGLRPGFCV